MFLQVADRTNNLLGTIPPCYQALFAVAGSWASVYMAGLFWKLFTDWFRCFKGMGGQYFMYVKACLWVRGFCEPVLEIWGLGDKNAAFSKALGIQKNRIPLSSAQLPIRWSTGSSTLAIHRGCMPVDVWEPILGIFALLLLLYSFCQLCAFGTGTNLGSTWSFRLSRRPEGCENAPTIKEIRWWLWRGRTAQYRHTTCWMSLGSSRAKTASVTFSTSFGSLSFPFL